MKVLFLYPKSDELIQHHVSMLAEGLRQSADIRVANSVSAFKKALKEQEPDIIHCHGCSDFQSARAAQHGVRKGARLVITPHGQLEPWVVKNMSVKEKTSKALPWQKNYFQKAYAVILLGQMERRNFSKIGWNRRTEEIHNAVITNSISQEDMCSATFAVYQKVLDSNTLERMNEETLHMLRAIIKVSILGDKRWARVLPSGEIQWRELLLYAEHEHIKNYVDYGISLLGSDTPLMDTTKIAAYFPDNYTPPKPIRETVGDFQLRESDYLLKMIKQIQQKPLLLHLIELTRELYRDSVDEEQLCKVLEDNKLTAFAASLMQILDEQTSLDEGYMPLDPADNRLTNKIRKQLTNHLKI